MCCNNLQTHVRVIAIVCIVLTALSALYLSTTITTLKEHHFQHRNNTGTSRSGFNTLYQGNTVAAICVQIVIYGIHLVCYICCLIGAQKRNRCLLIPFIILTSLHILLCAGSWIVASDTVCSAH